MEDRATHRIPWTIFYSWHGSEHLPVGICKFINCSPHGSSLSEKDLHQRRAQMGRFPREEIPYTKLYNELDLERDLGIDWPQVERETFSGKLSIPDSRRPSSQEYFPDEYDQEFCTEHGIEMGFFLSLYSSLEGTFTTRLRASLSSLSPLEPLSHCDICGRTEVDGDVLVACNGCSIAVHRGCYGIENIEDEYWFCSSCLILAGEVECSYCRIPGGILKLTDKNTWVHALCAILHPGLSFLNLRYKEPVDTSELVKTRGKCGVCGVRSKFLVHCGHGNCTARYHPPCAAENLFCDLGNRVIYCPAHDPSDWRHLIAPRSRIKEYRAAYPILDGNIFVRRRVPITKPSATKFSSILTQEPQAEIPFEVSDHPHASSILEYWKNKKRAYWSYFVDPFFFVNHLNGPKL